jgi:RNA polymerase sigma-70 factor, ECF subfamily
MSSPSSHLVTQLLHELQDGNAAAADRLAALVYDELRRMAARYMRAERTDITLQPTDLVHEAYLRLVDQRDVHWRNRAHFFGVAAQAMRRILVDHARQHRAAKRCGGQRVTLDADVAITEGRSLDLLALDDALARLATLDARQSQVVELRFFGGLDIAHTAEALGVSPATVKRDWLLAKAWLHRELADPPA